MLNPLEIEPTENIHIIVDCSSQHEVDLAILRDVAALEFINVDKSILNSLCISGLSTSEIQFINKPPETIVSLVTELFEGILVKDILVDNFPNLTKLTAINTDLLSLPPLPRSLRELVLVNTNLVLQPEWPENLTTLHLFNNGICKLDNLPSRLEHLIIEEDSLELVDIETDLISLEVSSSTDIHLLGKVERLYLTNFEIGYENMSISNRGALKALICNIDVFMRYFNYGDLINLEYLSLSKGIKENFEQGDDFIYKPNLLSSKQLKVLNSEVGLGSTLPDSVMYINGSSRHSRTTGRSIDCVEVTYYRR